MSLERCFGQVKQVLEVKHFLISCTHNSVMKVGADADCLPHFLSHTPFLDVYLKNPHSASLSLC